MVPLRQSQIPHLSGPAVALVVVLAVIGTACTASSDSERLLVSAASSLAEAFEEIATAYELEHPGIDVELNIAGSSRLREQIIGGAPIDVFASADTEAMDAVQDSVTIVGTPRVFALNSLVIGVPVGNPGGVTALNDLASETLLVGVCIEVVPCGRYADQVFTLAGVEPDIDSREPDVGSLVLKLELGELDAGIVYTTDALRSAGGFVSIPIPEDHNIVATYPIVAVSSSAASQDFVDFVLSEQGRAILLSNGFELP